jgi:hypothetical protein
MAKTTIKIPNFISGVSQQVPELRFPAQQEAQTNGLPSLKNGFGKRYPFETIARLPATLNAFNQWHFIDRGTLTNEDPWSSDWSDDFGDTPETSQYAIAFGDSVIQAINLQGRLEEVLEIGNSLDYLSTPEPKNDLEFITVQDFTYVLNKTIVPAMTTEVDTLRPFEALVFVAEARAYSDYKIFINDVEQATFVQGASSATMSTNRIATDLEGDLLLNLDLTKFTVVRNGSTIYIASLEGIDFNIRTEEGDGENILKVFKGTTSKFSALPKLALNGFRIKIENDPDYQEDDFWVEYESDSITDQGRWKESRQDGLINIIDKTTMPHQLIHNASDAWSDDWSDEWGIQTFSLSPVTWSDRLVGDATSIPEPSFIGSPIKDIFFMRNRLGFLSGENTIQTEDGNAKNFWRTTLQTFLDTEPIDVGTSHNKSSSFTYAVPSQEQLLLFSRDTQFIYGSGDNVLSPKTVFINPDTEIAINPKVRPFILGNSVFFGVDKNIGTTIQEITTVATDDHILPNDITSHVPDYIPEDLAFIEGSDVGNLLFLVSNEELGSIYLYKFLNEGGNRILSSWSKWTHAGVTEVSGLKAIRDNLYRVATYAETSANAKFLEKANLTSDYLNTGLGHPVLLDRMITVQGVYDSTTRLTTWNLPYDDTDALTMVLDESFPVPGSELKQSKITRPSLTSLSYPGDWTAGQVIIGKRYTTETELTQPVLKSVENGAPIVDRSAVFTVHGFTVDFHKTSTFDIEVTYKDGTVRTYPYSGFLTANTDFSVGQFNFNSDSYSIPIKTKGRRKIVVKIKSNSYVPCNIYSGKWTMNITRRQGRF